MAPLKLILLLLLPLIAIATALPLNSEIDADVQEILAKNPRLTFLGSVGKKEFYMEQTYQTWDQANDCCKNLGLELVTIKSKAEQNFLTSVLPGTPIGTYWTSGRDSGSLSQFKWGDGKALGKFGNDVRTHQRSCIGLHFQGSWNDLACTAQWFSVCEMNKKKI